MAKIRSPLDKSVDKWLKEQVSHAKSLDVWYRKPLVFSRNTNIPLWKQKLRYWYYKIFYRYWIKRTNDAVWFNRTFFTQPPPQ